MTDPLGLAAADVHTQLMLSIGIVIVALLDGALLTLGIACFVILSPKGRLPSLQQKYMRAYLAVLLFINLGYEAAFFVWNNLPAIFASTPVSQQLRISNAFVFVGKLTPVAILGLTDGLLVWRCYKIHRILGPNNAKLWNIFWFFPLCLWVITIVTVSVGGALIETIRLRTGASALQATAFASNVLLNLFSTLYITIRLLLHRRMVIKYFGPDTPTPQHLGIIAILLQAAAINVPITVAGAVGIGGGELFGLIVATIALACQSLASVIIIHQVALGRAISQENEANSERLRQMRNHDYDLGFQVTEAEPTSTIQPA